MKVKYEGTIKEVHKENFSVVIKLACNGSVVEPKVIGEAKDSSMEVIFNLKPIVANSLKLGAKITITLSDEEE